MCNWDAAPQLTDLPDDIVEKMAKEVAEEHEAEVAGQKAFDEWFKNASIEELDKFYTPVEI